jgi:hypothetical protein
MAKASKKSEKKATKKTAKKAGAKTVKKAARKTAANTPKKAAKKTAKKAKQPAGTWQVVCNVHGPLGTYPNQAAANLAFARHTENFPDDKVKILTN